jgi:hypothetical protein
MTKEEARRILDLVRGGTVQIRLSRHLWDRVAQRAPGLKATEIMSVLETGVIRGDPVPDASRGNNKVRVRGSVVGHGILEVVVAIPRFDAAVVVTIYKVKGK